MPNFGAINHYGNPQQARVSLYPHGAFGSDHDIIQSMKRGNRREQTRRLPNIITIGNRTLPVRWVA